MRVKSIVLDGFKSYAHRRELADLSPHFNAITGLNGSGKSNIFDAICFVMGITNLKRMRADDPRELLYRAGTTGVHAARVTIEFINDDPATAPPGYSCEEYPIITVGRQIKLGGKQQFFLNNTVSMQSRVKRFFESISLNVDNPHFMVLQGTVHKLIGMRSADMLSLIEEAVGTKAFDHRRRTAETLMKNKEKKIQEIDENIQTQIGPMLEAMKADQEAYRRFLQITEGLEEKRNFRRAYEYFKRMNTMESVRSQLSQLRDNMEHAKTQLQGIPALQDQLARRLLTCQEGLSAPCEASVQLHEEESEKKKLQSRVQGTVAATNKRLAQLKAARQQLAKEERQLQQQAEKFLQEKSRRKNLDEALKVKKEEVHNLQQSLQLLKAGVRAGISGLSLEEERQQLDVKRIQLQAALGRNQEALEDLTKEIDAMESRQAKVSSSLKTLQKQKEEASQAFTSAESVYRAKVAPLLELQSKTQEEIKGLRRDVERFHDQFQRENGGRSSFELSFNRRACRSSSNGDIETHILGRVGELVIPTGEEYSRALVVGAHQQLLRVVVDHDSVAEQIIHHGLQQRTSFLPLNKVQVNRDEVESIARRFQEAKKIATQLGGFAYLAKDLVKVVHPHNGTVKSEKDAEMSTLRVLADFVFGQFVVCSTLKIAEEIAYTAGARIKSVTLDGEIAEPHGIMTGGSASTIRNLFAELQAFAQRKAPLAHAQAQLAEAEEKLRQLQDQLRREDGVVQAYRIAEEKWEVVREQWDRAEGGGNTEQMLAELQTQRQTHQTATEETKQQLEKVLQRRKEIEAEASVDVSAAQKDLKRKLAATESELAKLIHEEEAGAGAFDRANAEAEERQATLQQQIQENEDEHQQATADLEQFNRELEEVERALEEVATRVQQTESTRRRMEKSIDEAQEDLARLQERQHNLENINRNGEVEKHQLQKQLDDLARHQREDDRRFPWIDGARNQFGDPTGPFYFQDENRTTRTLQELTEAEAHTALMSKRVSKKSSTVLYEDRKKEYEELVQQRQALGQDKEAIQACIRGIEDRKWHALDRMVGVVSSVFGKLFETCLPGATAALIEERDSVGHLCGLGVRVEFNGKAKESLSELSGGQRSLLALCLILAILRVRQAPIYILDEVDAALDPSHTQNIGLMLHTYFPTSQFLLVSLKDGMFNNANVLYHVRNTQGYSEVSRVAQAETS